MHHVHGTYDSMLVVFSYVVAVAASYTVLDLVERIVASPGWRKWVWLTYGAIAMGMGIWSMHFVGMLAFSLPEPVAYDLGEVVLSVFAAILGSFAALGIVSHGKLDGTRLIGAGVLLTAGICAMHYIGMAAMVIGISYDYAYVALSIVIALIASIAALWLSLYFRREGSRARRRLDEAGQRLDHGRRHRRHALCGNDGRKLPPGRDASFLYRHGAGSEMAGVFDLGRHVVHVGAQPARHVRLQTVLP